MGWNWKGGARLVCYVCVCACLFPDLSSFIASLRLNRLASLRFVSLSLSSRFVSTSLVSSRIMLFCLRLFPIQSRLGANLLEPADMTVFVCVVRLCVLCVCSPILVHRSRLVSPRFASPRFASPRFASSLSRLVSSRFVSSRTISCHVLSLVFSFFVSLRNLFSLLSAPLVRSPSAHR